MTEHAALTCVGLMSGTSVDGIDVAIVEIVGRPPALEVKVRHFETVPFSEAVRSRIFHLFDLEKANVSELSTMNFLLGHVFADATLTALRNAGIAPHEVAFVASHGQTIYHNPVPELIDGYEVISTLQIGEASVIAEKTGITTISDFRVRDMAAGGQGAPLVPFVDKLLFTAPDKGRIAANIGGIANLTVLPAGGRSEPLGFDTGPGNMILDGLVQKITGGTKHYDQDGKIAQTGQVNEAFLAKWLELPYFAAQPPKSTGRELFGAVCVEQWWSEGQAAGLAPQDLVRTATEFTARTFADAIKRFVLPAYAIEEMFVGGGGSYNPVLMDSIRKHLPNLVIEQQEATGIPGDAKEAVCFAVLGYECFHQRPNNLPSVTGAARPVVMGKVVRSQEGQA
ncbi:anhydro-N-acetylmuramic acid kinase [Tumebacillus algifaecis]|uniref:Anhydro-N-acetylmuramic acid kinase n=1 Tax=Tumebacillus algifaecis TaxID=1214604 RepID=A0A223D1V9_9BACL|nr:anhydro-N-acetylmuramic acid kinase [Tumebacillus algifaecis]ASS75326.1 anhydro-N-acetylmuramic acid kinase [Tumebacillus algifaecis]